MPIASDHVAYYEATSLGQYSRHLIEDRLKCNKMMQGLIGHYSGHGLIVTPAVQVGFPGEDMCLHALAGSILPAALEHGRIHVQALDSEVVHTLVTQEACNPYLGIAVAGPKTDYRL